MSKDTCYFTMTLLAFSLIMLFCWLHGEQQDCQSRGGVLVRGVFGYECLGRETPHLTQERMPL